jgi:hypothetical protein
MELCYVHEAGAMFFVKSKLKEHPILDFYSTGAIVVNDKDILDLTGKLMKIKSQFNLQGIELHPKKIMDANKKPFDKLRDKDQNKNLMLEIGKAIADTDLRLISRVTFPISKLMKGKTKRDFRPAKLYRQTAECIANYYQEIRGKDTPFYVVVPDRELALETRWELFRIWENWKNDGLKGFQGLVIDCTHQSGPRRNKEFPWLLVDGKLNMFLGPQFLSLRETAHYLAYVTRGNKATGKWKRYRWYKEFFEVVSPHFLGKRRKCKVQGYGEIRI